MHRTHHSYTHLLLSKLHLFLAFDPLCFKKSSWKVHTMCSLRISCIFELLRHWFSKFFLIFVQCDISSRYYTEQLLLKDSFQSYICTLSSICRPHKLRKKGLHSALKSQKKMQTKSGKYSIWPKNFSKKALLASKTNINIYFLFCPQIL